MYRLEKTSVDMVTLNQQTVQCGIMIDTGETAEDSSGHSDTVRTDGTL